MGEPPLEIVAYSSRRFVTFPLKQNTTTGPVGRRWDSFSPFLPSRHSVDVIPFEQLMAFGTRNVAKRVATDRRLECIALPRRCPCDAAVATTEIIPETPLGNR